MAEVKSRSDLGLKTTKLVTDKVDELAFSYDVLYRTSKLLTIGLEIIYPQCNQAS